MLKGSDTAGPSVNVRCGTVRVESTAAGADKLSVGRSTTPRCTVSIFYSLYTRLPIVDALPPINKDHWLPVKFVTDDVRPDSLGIITYMGR